MEFSEFEIAVFFSFVCVWLCWTFTLLEVAYISLRFENGFLTRGQTQTLIFQYFFQARLLRSFETKHENKTSFTDNTFVKNILYSGWLICLDFVCGDVSHLASDYHPAVDSRCVFPLVIKTHPPHVVETANASVMWCVLSMTISSAQRTSSLQLLIYMDRTGPRPCISVFNA